MHADPGKDGCTSVEAAAETAAIDASGSAAAAEGDSCGHGAGADTRGGSVQGQSQSAARGPDAVAGAGLSTGLATGLNTRRMHAGRVKTLTELKKKFAFIEPEDASIGDVFFRLKALRLPPEAVQVSLALASQPRAFARFVSRVAFF